MAETAEHTKRSARNEPENDSNEATKTLCDLPVELLQAVAQEADTQDILALRLVCRDTSAKVDDVFVEKFFQNRRHLITKHSLEVLVEIVRRPRLRAKLQKVSLLTVKIRRTWIPSEARPPPKEEYGSRDLFQLHQTYHPLDLQEWDRRHEIWERASAHEDFLSSGADIELLSSALQELKEAGVIPKLSLEDNLYSHPRAYGCHRLESDLGLSLDLDKESEMNGLFRSPDNTGSTMMLLSSIGHTRFPVRELFLLPLFGVGNMLVFMLPWDLATSLHASFATLTTLKLRITQYEPEDVVANESMSGKRAFEKLFSSCAAVENLVIWLETSEEDALPHQLCADILGAFKECKLRTVGLYGGSCSADILASFFFSHRETLHQISLHGLELPERNDWNSIFKLLSTTPLFEIKECTLSHLQYDDKILEHGWHPNGDFWFQEDDVPGEVKAGLQWLAEYARFGEEGVEVRTRAERELGEEWKILWEAMGVVEDSPDSEDDDDENGPSAEQGDAESAEL